MDELDGLWADKLQTRVQVAILRRRPAAGPAKCAARAGLVSGEDRPFGGREEAQAGMHALARLRDDRPSRQWQREPCADRAAGAARIADRTAGYGSAAVHRQSAAIRAEARRPMALGLNTELKTSFPLTASHKLSFRSSYVTTSSSRPSRENSACSKARQIPAETLRNRRSSKTTSGVACIVELQPAPACDQEHVLPLRADRGIGPGERRRCTVCRSKLTQSAG